MRLGADSQFSDFLDGLGPGQLVGRQTLATPAMGERRRETSLTVWVLHRVSPAGDVQIGLMDKKGQLEVEVIRARGLTPKPGSKSLPGTTPTLQLSFQQVGLLPSISLPLFLPSFPAPYVKVYLLDNGTCKAKKKTKIARKTLEPLYQQHLLFDESPQGKVLQVTRGHVHFSVHLLCILWRAPECSCCHNCHFDPNNCFPINYCVIASRHLFKS